MNKALCLVLAILSGTCLATGARAQAILIDLDGLTNPQQGRIGSFVSIAVNNAAIDGSITAHYTASAFLEHRAYVGTDGGDSLGTAQSAVAGSLGDVEATVLGAVKYGDISLGMALILDDASAGPYIALSNYLGPLQNSLAANLVLNQDELNASVSVAAVNYALDAGDITTIAIGAVSSSAILTRLDNSLPDITVVAAN